VLLVLVLPLEDVTFREVLGRADEQSLFDEEVIWLFFGDSDEVRHDIGDQAELLDAVVPFSTDIDHSERVCVGATVETVHYQVQPSDRLPVVVSEDEVRLVVLVDRSQLAQGVEDLSLSASVISSSSSWSLALLRTSSGTGDSSSGIMRVSLGGEIWFME
jgi:hypothetical protein